MKERILIIFSTLCFAFSLELAYKFFLMKEWSYFGFTYKDKTTIEYFYILFLIIIPSLNIPSSPKKPSAFLLIILFLVIYIPTIIMTFNVNAERLQNYGLNLMSLCLCYVGMNYITEKYKIQKIKKLNLNWKIFNTSLTVFFVLLFFILIYSFRSTMNLVGIEDMYSQRFASAEISNSWLNYSKSFFLNLSNSFNFI